MSEYRKIIVLLLLVIFFAVATALTLPPKPKTKPYPPPTPSVPTLPTPSPDPIASWQTYFNSDYMFTINYPPTLTAKEETSDLFEHQIVFTNQPNSPENFTITIKTNDETHTLEQEITYWRWTIVGHIADKIDKESDYPHQSLSAKRLDYTPVGQKTQRSLILLPHPNYFFIIGAQSDLIDSYLNNFSFLAVETKTNGKFCGGIAANLPENQCPTDYYCKLDGKYPDAGGTCIRR